MYFLTSQVYLVILNLVVHGVIPLLLLTFLNILVYRQVRLERSYSILHKTSNPEAKDLD
jgi:hypothetical protein